MQRRRSILVLLFGGTIAALIFVLVILAGLVLRQLEDLRAEPTDSSEWALLQVSAEFWRLNAAYASFRAVDDEAARKDLRLRFDIFYSRVNLLASSRAFAGYRDREFFAMGLEALGQFVDKLGPLIDQGRYEELRAGATIESDFKRTGAIVSDFVTSAVQVNAALSDANRRTLFQLLVYGAVAVALLFVCLLSTLAILFRQHSELRDRQKEIDQQYQMFQATVRSSLDGVIVIDGEGTIVAFNDSAGGIFGHDPGKVIGLKMAEVIIPERYRKAHGEGMARYAETGQGNILGRRVEVEALKADGREIPVELSVNSVRSGTGSLFVAFVRDISQRRSDQEALMLAKNRAEEASRVKAQFLAAMSHEIRTPLTGIMGVLDLLKTTKPSAAQQRYIETASRSGEALLSVISDVIDVTKLEAGASELQIAAFDLPALIEDVLMITSQLARQRENEVSVRGVQDVPRHLLGDQAKIRQILLNLLTNAAKFTFQGKIEIGAKVIHRSADRVELELYVSDTGVGISEKDLPRLFTDFSQLESGYARRAEGSGLGLSISKRLVQMMGGEIGVDSKPGAGSRFWIRLGLDLARPESAEPAQEPTHRQAMSAKKPLNILVVDDNETIRTIVYEMLTSCGHSVSTAGDGPQGIEAARAKMPDLVLMDISMPGMDGIEAIRSIRALPDPIKLVPIIALTAHTLSGDRDKCLAAGANEFLSKPIRLPALLATIEQVLNAEKQVKAADASRAPGEHDPLIDLAEMKAILETVPMEAFRGIIRQFCAELDRKGATLSQQALEMSTDELRRFVHSLAGSSATIGAKRLSALAETLEDMASNGLNGDARRYKNELEDVIRETRHAVDRAMVDLGLSP